MSCQFHLIIFICCIVASVQLQSIPVNWESLINLSNHYFEFSPVDEQALFLTNTTADSILSCIRLCHYTPQCRIFDFDGQSHRCRLFEGNIATMGSIVVSSSFQSRIGSIILHSDQFVNHGQPCSFCLYSRYLKCVNETCQCYSHTYFDGSICQSQKLLGDDCNNITECRSDLNYTCLSRQQCGPASIQIATIIAGKANGNGGSSLSALQFPMGFSIGVDNSVYIAEYGNHRVIKLPEGSLVGSIVAGTGTAGNAVSQLNQPIGVYVDASLNIYVGDSANYRIMFWRQNASVGVKVAGTGSFGYALSSFGTIGGLVVDSQGNIYVCDSTNHRVMKFTPNVTNAMIVAGTGVAGSGSYQLNIPCDIYLDETNSYLYVADHNNHRIQRYHVGVSTNGTSVTGGYGQGSSSQQLNSPYSVYVSKITNAIYIADSGNSRVQCWNFGATSGVTVAGNGASTNNYSTPVQGTVVIRLNINGTSLFVSETNYNRVWRFKLI